MAVAGLAPVSGRARIDVLDMLRGFAILGIFFMNIPFMAQQAFLLEFDPRVIGWSAADQNAWALVQIFLEGTQRCLLEFLFGAGMMVMAAKAMAPDGPVAVADLYYRRNLWLLGFGLIDIFVLLWPGDILHIYALSALFLFPFRTLGPRWLLALGLIFATATAVPSAFEYGARADLVAKVAVAHQHQAAHQPVTKADKAALADWKTRLDKRKPGTEELKLAKQDRKARGPGGSFTAYASDLWGAWFYLVGKGSIVFGVVEAFSTMLIGIALWKWRVIQGGRSARFYLVLMLAAYGFGITARWLGVQEQLTFAPVPKTIWITYEYARIAMALGHLALVNLAIKSAAGRAFFTPFKAAGRMAFSLYFLEQIIGIFILFAPFGLGLWGKFGWAALAEIAAAVFVFGLMFANIWMRFFVAGPLEWAWRSLAYLQWQPFLRPREAGEGDAVPLPA